MMNIQFGALSLFALVFLASPDSFELKAAEKTPGAICPDDFDKSGEPIYDHNDRFSADDAFKRYQEGMREFKLPGGQALNHCMSDTKKSILAMDAAMVKFIESTDSKTGQMARARLQEIRDFNRESPLIKNFWYGESQSALPKVRSK